MSEPRTCSSCGARLREDDPAGLCQACLLKLGLAPGENKDPPPPESVAPHSSTAEGVGGRIGPYKLLAEIGEGGCGVVFVAEQEKPVRRRAALKVIKPGMDSKQVIARFEAERQALALMEHPNIAKVLDAGTTEAGRPYFVMELVKGERITDYCDKNKLPASERLNLFIQVCRAIQHAHQKGIIHRDIKPSNILVTVQDGAPVPKVIDFGIAKATTGQPLSDHTLFTSIAQFIGTPAYMSPEQAEMTGLDIDTRSDIYSLGVLLYELLTGQTPFDSKKLVRKGIDEIRRIIREVDPPRPSTRLSTLNAAERTAVAARRHSEPPKLIGLIRGDLDWIVMKCLEKDRTRRYETANGLAMDIQRNLDCEPVVARPPGGLYRFQKSLKRNKLVYSAVTVVVAALIVALGMTAWMLRRERQAREQAVTATEEAVAARTTAQQAQANEPKQKASAQAALYDSLIGQARATRLARRLGYRDRVFGLLERAKALDVAKKNPADLRNEAVACLGDFVGLNPVGFTNFPAGATISLAIPEPDGRGAAFLLSDGTILVNDVSSGKPPVRLGAKAPGRKLWFSPAGDRLFSLHFSEAAHQQDAFRDATVCTWRRGVGNHWARTSTAAVPGAFDLLGAGENLFLALAGTNGEVSLVRFGDRQVLLRIAPPAAPSQIQALALSADSHTLAVAGSGQVEIWDLLTGKMRRSINPGFEFGVFDVALSAEGGYLACLSALESAVYDSSGRRLSTKREYMDAWSGLAFIGGGTTLALPFRLENRVRLWDGVSGREVASLQIAGDVSQTAVSPDGSQLLAYGGRGAWLFHLQLPEKMSLPEHPAAAPGICFSPDGAQLVTFCRDGMLRAWDTAKGGLAWEAGPLAAQGQSVSYNSDGRFLATTSWGFGQVCIWDAKTGRRLLELPGAGPGFIWSARFSPGSKYLVAASNHGLTIWALDLTNATNPRARVVKTLQGDCAAAAFLPNGSSVAFMAALPPRSGHFCLFRWGFRRDKPPDLLARGLTWGPKAFSWSSNGEQITAIALGRFVIGLKAGTGEAVSLFPECDATAAPNSAPEPSLALSPDGSKVAVTTPSCLGFAVQAYPGGKLLYRLPDQDSKVQCISWSPDSRRLAVSREDGEVAIWSLPEMEKALAGFGMKPEAGSRFQQGEAAYGEAIEQAEAEGPQAAAYYHRLRAAFYMRQHQPLKAEQDDHEALVIERGPVPPRDPAAKPNLIDLTPYYNAVFTEDWHNKADKGNNLALLHPGVGEFAGTAFDARGIIQVSSGPLRQVSPEYPLHVNGIKVAQKCRRLHFLVGAGWADPDGTTIGTFVVHFGDGLRATIPIVYGRDVRSWQVFPGMDNGDKYGDGGVVAWRGTQKRWENLRGFGVRLYEMTWRNPRPTVEVATIDFVSANRNAAPFLIAITADP